MSQSPQRNPIDQTDDYLEWLAGRGEKEPQLDPADEDILKATRLLGTLREHDPRPALIPKIKHAVLATSQHVPTTPMPKPHRFTGLLLWKIASPAVAVAVVVVTVLLSQAAPAENHAGTNFKKKTVTPAVAAVVDLVATKEDVLGVDATTSFTLTAKEGKVTLAEVEKNFALQPAVEFLVSQKDDATFEVAPKEALKPGTVYAASYTAEPVEVDGVVQPRSYSWAYQVRSDFKIIGLLPRHQATGVSLSSGIEVTFSSAGVTADDFQKNFSIFPETLGRVEVHQRTLVFIPAKPLAEKTVYTVTVKKGLRPPQAETGLGADETFQFETTVKNEKDSETFYSSFFPSQLFETVRPNEPLVFGAGNNPYAGGAKPSASEFTIYQYKDLPTFISAIKAQEATRSMWAIYGSRGGTHAVDGLKKVGVYKTSSKDDVLTLGPGFSKGFYIADGGTGTSRAQIPFVVSTIGSYSMTTKTDALVWAHDLETKKPLTGATLTIPGTEVTVTLGADGVARFPTPFTADDGAYMPAIAVLTTGQVESPVLLNGTQYSGFGFKRYQASTDFWSYLSLDRSLYQPTDTVQFWGLLRRRDQPRPGETITARLVQRTFDSRYEEQTIAETTLTTSTSGTFIGSLALRGVPTNVSTVLEISIDGQTVLERYLNIETYRKPPFQIIIQPDQYAVLAGETVTYTISTKFFDGTPVPNTELREAYGAGTGKGIVTTNARGEATLKRKLELNSGSLALEPTDAQLQTITGSSYVQVYPAAVEMVTSTTLTGTTGTLTGTVYEVQPENITPSTTDIFADLRGPAKPNQVIAGSLKEIIYDKVKTGSHYDFLLKETVDDYQYNNREEEREAFSLTSAANGTFTKTFTLGAKSIYRVDLTTKDDKDREAVTSGYFWRSEYNNIYNQSQYSLTDVVQRDGSAAPTYGVGAEVTLELNRGGDVAAVPTEGSILYTLSQRGLRRYTVSTSSKFSFTFGEADTPSISSRAVIFTGTGYAEAIGPTTVIDRTTRALTIDLKTDKPTYNPGDRVQVSITTTDPNGRGQAARVNLKAVDEALLSLASAEDSYYVPGNIYNQVDDGVLGSYISHQAIESRAMAEGGGGGGDRVDFKDTAVFTEVTTDAQGKGVFSFTLPDNLTTWRLTAQGFTDGLLAGTTQSPLVVSKDLFVAVLTEPDQVSRDKTSVSASAFGRSLTATDEVTYTFSVLDQSGSEKVTKGKAFVSILYRLPELAPGSYRVRVMAEAKGLKDVVELPITVSASRLQRRTVKSVMLPSATLPTYSSTGRTVFRFDDADRNLAYETLWSLVGATHNRLDDVVASELAQQVLETSMKESIGGEPSTVQQFLTGKGLALYPIGSENLEAGALAAGAESFVGAREQLLTWFRTTLDDPKQNTEQVTQALYGLAQLGEPVLPEIRALLAQQDVPERDQITLLLALETLGASEEARPRTLTLLQKYAESQDQYVRIHLGESDDEKIVNSARFAILAAGLGLDERYGLLRYVNAYQPKDTRTTLERALATQTLLQHTSATTATVTYDFDGKTATATLTANQPLLLSADPVQVKTLAIQKTTGRVSVLSTYQEPFDITTASREARLSLTRTYLVNGKKTTTFAVGDLVRVQFTWSKKSDVVGKNFSITDLLPTGLRPVSNPWAYDRSNLQNAPYAIAGQRVSLYAGEKNSTFYYLARASAPGQAVAEPAILQAFDAPSSIQYSNEAVVEIK